jgi:hypothetical protein
MLHAPSLHFTFGTTKKTPTELCKFISLQIWIKKEKVYEFRMIFCLLEINMKFKKWISSEEL